MILRPHSKDLGGFSVRRLLPAAASRQLGPFVFFDHMGPARFGSGQGIDVRPHPHIGLATVTFLFEGALLHRDSLGTVQSIEPGAVNWMTAGHGIVHSERTAPEVRRAPSVLHGIQAWVALPVDQEACEPSFVHIPSDALPRIQGPGVEAVLIAGTWCGQRSPAPVASPLFYLSVQMAAGATLDIDDGHAQRAVYAVDGDIDVDGTPLAAEHMAVLAEGGRPVLQARTATRVMLLGGAPLDGERFMNWNFVASRREAIDAARERWRLDQFPGVPGEQERIPLPE